LIPAPNTSAALQTATRCLVIEGGAAPIPAVIQQAELKQVPLILVKSNTAATVAALEETLLGARFNQEKKLARLDEIMGKHCNFPVLYQSLGLTK
jgi:BioD-like phosphotransacetylase family protein